MIKNTPCKHDLAKKCYNITSKEDLARFSTHSIRVGACVALHVANFTTEQIQHALRWRSNAFKMYLRDVIALAEQRNIAVTAFCPDGASARRAVTI